MKKIFPAICVLSLAGLIVATTPSKAISGPLLTLLAQAQPIGAQCQPTPSDYLGPYYKAGAPVRASVGKGYELKGTVKSAADCAPIGEAKIELWLTNPEGDYDDDHRATVYSRKDGAYRLESNFPPGYSGRPPHIHIRISASGLKTLATQHYPVAGSTSGVFDIILVPIN